MSRASLATSISGHVAALAWLMVWLHPTIVAPSPPEQKFDLAFAPMPTIATVAEPVQPPPAPAVTDEPQAVAAVPPASEQPIAAPDVPPAAAPDVPVVHAVEPPPPAKPVAKPLPKPVAKLPRPVYQPPAEPAPNVASYTPPPPVYARPMPPPVYARPAPQPAYAPPPQPVYARPAPTMAALPPPAPRPDLAANYRAMLSMWFESHKRYPDSARTNSEQGSAVVRFVVDRSGRIVTYGLLRSTGYADLDSAIAEMLRSAQLPPFPAGLSLSQLDVSVTLRFALTQ